MPQQQSVRFWKWSGSTFSTQCSTCTTRGPKKANSADSPFSVSQMASEDYMAIVSIWSHGYSFTFVAIIWACNWGLFFDTPCSYWKNTEVFWDIV